MQERFSQIKFKYPLIYLAVCWGFYIYSTLTAIDLSGLALQPRKLEGLPGIIFACCLHGGFPHILGNSIFLLITCFILHTFYGKVANKIMLIGMFGTGILVWVTGRSDTFHLGASGTVFALLGFLGSIGLFKKEMVSIIVSGVILIMFGSKVALMFPDPFSHISWEYHLCGCVLGILCAYLYSKHDDIKLKF